MIGDVIGGCIAAGYVVAIAWGWREAGRYLEESRLRLKHRVRRFPPPRGRE